MRKLCIVVITGVLVFGFVLSAEARVKIYNPLIRLRVESHESAFNKVSNEAQEVAETGQPKIYNPLMRFRVKTHEKIFNKVSNEAQEVAETGQPKTYNPVMRFRVKTHKSVLNNIQSGNAGLVSGGISGFSGSQSAELGKSPIGRLEPKRIMQ